MKLNGEWTERIEKWYAWLTDKFYTPVEDVEFEVFFTKEQLSYEEAMKRSFTPIKEGTPWGDINEIGWFRATITIPEVCKGKMININSDVGGEANMWVNGRLAGQRRAEWVFINHHFYCDAILTKDAKPGEKFEIVLSATGSTGTRECSPFVVNYKEEPYPDFKYPVTTMRKCTFGVWNEEVYQLWADFDTIYGIYKGDKMNSVRKKNIAKALMKLTTIIDFELPFDEFLETCREAKALLKPLLECKNGSSAPMFYSFGHSHIDVAWLWPLHETERKVGRTFSTQIQHLNYYPKYRFLQSQPHLYRMCKNLYPGLYEEIKEKVKEGRFIPEGGMWVEADTNITGGESLIRQFIHGKRFFKDEFGVDNKLLWLPDVFGYSGALPQICKGCGIDYFSTQKLSWNRDGEKFPYTYFNWKGIDGSVVTAFLHEDYNSTTHSESMIERWEDRRQPDMDIDAFLVPFGYGDGGCGPTRDHIEFQMRQSDLEGAPKNKMASPIELFEDAREAGVLPTESYTGELYLQCHRGTYTSQAKTKKGNRKTELLLREMEMLSSAAVSKENYEYAIEVADEAWKTVLLNQFHDILPGSSVHEVYQTAEKAYADAQAEVRVLEDKAVGALVSDQEDCMSVFNSISWDRSELVEIPNDWEGACDASGKIPTQRIEDKNYAKVALPHLGWNVIKKSAESCQSDAVKATAQCLENSKIKVDFNENGEIISIYNKATDTLVNAGVCNEFKMYKDIPNSFDAWDIDSNYISQPVALGGECKIEVIAAQGMVGVIKVTKKLHNSEMSQYISLKADAAQVDFTTTIDWKEDHKLLKVAFPANVFTKEALHDIQFGYLARPNHKSTKFGKDRFEVSNHKWTALRDETHGFAILNDCKYGVSVDENNIELTLLKSASAPDKTADKGVQEFTYSLYVWDGAMIESDLYKNAYALNCQVVAAKGCVKDCESLVDLSKSNIVVDTIKPAEDGSNDIIIRAYETYGAATRCKMKINLEHTAVELTNMLEEKLEAVAENDGEITLDFRAFEIKTLRVKK